MATYVQVHAIWYKAQTVWCVGIVRPPTSQTRVRAVLPG